MKAKTFMGVVYGANLISLINVLFKSSKPVLLTQTINKIYFPFICLNLTLTEIRIDFYTEIKKASQSFK